MLDLKEGFFLEWIIPISYFSSGMALERFSCGDNVSLLSDCSASVGEGYLLEAALAEMAWPAPLFFFPAPLFFGPQIGSFG